MKKNHPSARRGSVEDRGSADQPKWPFWPATDARLHVLDRQIILLYLTLFAGFQLRKHKAAMGVAMAIYNRRRAKRLQQDIDQQK